MNDTSTFTTEIGLTLRKALHADYGVSNRAKIEALSTDTWRFGTMSISHRGEINEALLVVYPHAHGRVNEPEGMIFAEIYPYENGLKVYYQVLSVNEYDELRNSINSKKVVSDLDKAA